MLGHDVSPAFAADKCGDCAAADLSAALAAARVRVGVVRRNSELNFIHRIFPQVKQLCNQTFHTPMYLVKDIPHHE